MLKMMPTEYHDKLSNLYDDSIDRIKGQEDYDADLGMNILQWLAFAKIPMTVDQLRHALAVEWKDGEDPHSELDRDNILDVTDLTGT